MARCLNHRSSHACMVIEIELCVGQLVAIEQIFQSAAVPAKISRVNQKVGVRLGRMLKNQRLGHWSGVRSDHL